MWRSALLRCSVALAWAALAGCATPPPSAEPTGEVSFRLAPASLGRALAWQQRLQVTTQGREQPPLDALLEVDEHGVQLALVGMGQTLARLTWDGRALQTERSAGWPSAISAERVLSDLQLALWPLAALQAALPADTTLVDEGPLRTLRRQGTLVATVRAPGSPHMELINHAQGYTLRIDSVPLNGGAP